MYTLLLHKVYNQILNKSYIIIMKYLLCIIYFYMLYYYTKLVTRNEVVGEKNENLTDRIK